MTEKQTRGSDRAYLGLLEVFPPVRIRSRAQAVATEKRIDEIGALPRLSNAQRAYLDLLSDLLADWEDEHEQITDIHGIELLRVLLKDHGLRQKDLVGTFATESVASEVLAGRRDLTRKQIEGLARFFHLPPAAFFPAPTQKSEHEWDRDPAAWARAQRRGDRRRVG